MHQSLLSCAAHVRAPPLTPHRHRRRMETIVDDNPNENELRVYDCCRCCCRLSSKAPAARALRLNALSERVTTDCALVDPDGHTDIHDRGTYVHMHAAASTRRT